jgi:hypothetical protein
LVLTWVQFHFCDTVRGFISIEGICPSEPGNGLWEGKSAAATLQPVNGQIVVRWNPGPLNPRRREEKGGASVT